MQNSMVMLIYFKNTVFGQIWSKNIKLLFSFEIWYLDKFEYAEFNDDADLFYFRLEVLVLSKSGPKNQNCDFELKFGISTNLKMQNAMVMLTFFNFRLGVYFLGKFGPKNQNCLF